MSEERGMLSDGLRDAVTFVLTDVEGSTRMWEREPAAMRAAMARHDALILEAVRRHGGAVVRSRGEGDSSFSVFDDPAAAAAAALDIQRALATEAWPGGVALRVRLAIHVGEAGYRDGDFYGSAINRCARLRGLAAGGQSVVSALTQAQIGHRLPPGAYLVDLGSHRLKDMAEPERIFQLSHPDLPSDFPDLRGLEGVPNNLPVQLTTFVGREREVVDLLDVLRGSRLVTLTGTGGCGKTRLALEVAAAISDKFEDGIWFADLGATTEAALVPNVVATAIGVGERAGSDGVPIEPGTALQDAVIAHLAARRSLLILDNCEHLLESSAALVSHLLGAASGLVILATSREVLGVPGEVAWKVPSLTTPDPLRLPDLAGFATFEAVRLFAERARRHDRHFQLSNDNMRPIAEICHRVAGIPLALELAAARVTVLSVDQVAERLNDQFRLLTSKSPGALSRQATLRGTVDWSYNLLDPAEASLFRRLAAFSGGWTLEAAEGVCAGGAATADVLDLLGRLVDKSLVLRESRTGPSRFRLLEPLRQYALEKLLESGEHDELREAHAAHFARLARTLGDRLTGSDQAQTLVILDAEMDNMRAALEWAIAKLHPTALEVAAPLRLYWLYRSMLSEGRAWLEEALQATPGAPPALRAEALMGAGRLAMQMGDKDQAGTYQAAALALAKEHQLRDAVAQATWHQAQLAMLRGDLDRGADLFEQAVVAAEGTKNEYLRMVVLLDSAQCAFALGADPTERVEEGLLLARRIGDDRNTALGLCVRARVAALQGRRQEANADLQEALSIARRIASRLAIADACVVLGKLLTESGNHADARGALIEAVELAAVMGDPVQVADSLNAVALLLARTGRPESSARLLGGATSIRSVAGEPVPPPLAAQLTTLASELESTLGPTIARGLVAAGAGMNAVQLAHEALSSLGVAP